MPENINVNLDEFEAMWTEVKKNINTAKGYIITADPYLGNYNSYYDSIIEHTSNINQNNEILKKCNFTNIITEPCVVYNARINDKNVILLNIKKNNITLNMIKNDDFTFKAVSSKKLKIQTSRTINSEIEIIKAISCVKIIGFKESSDIFGYLPTKKIMYDLSQNTLDEDGKVVKKGERFRIEDIKIDFVCKKDNEKRDIITLLSNSGKKLKFLLSDVEFIYPNVNKYLNGYKKPKNKTKKNGVTIRIINKKSIDNGKVGKIKDRLPDIGRTSYYNVLIDNESKVIKGKYLKIINNDK